MWRGGENGYREESNGVKGGVAASAQQWLESVIWRKTTSVAGIDGQAVSASMEEGGIWLWRRK
jgi:hypothetical protein